MQKTVKLTGILEKFRILISSMIRWDLSLTNDYKKVKFSQRTSIFYIESVSIGLIMRILFRREQSWKNFI